MKDDAAQAGSASAGALLRMAIGSVVVGSMAVAFAISFAALIYTGPAAEFLGPAVQLALFGAAAMALVGTALHRLPVISGPQDVTAVLLSSGAATAALAAGPEAAGPSAAAFVAGATLATGLLVLLAGRLRLGHLARFIPYPVLGGFMAATGYLLTIGAIGLALGRPVDIRDLPGALAPDQAALWAPWLALGAALAVGMRRSDGGAVLPLGVLAGIAAFYAWLAASGRSLAEAEAAGLLLGPFPEGGIGDLAGAAARIDWGAAASAAPIVPVVAALALLGTLLNMSGLEATLRRQTDFDADLRAVGATNIAAAGTGGFVGYPMMGETLLVHRFGLTGTLASLVLAAMCTAAALLGADAFGLLPRGIFAAVIGFLGIDLLIRWLWEERRGLPARDLSVVLLILVVAAVVGFLEALGTGLAVAAAMFVASYARLDPLRARTTLAARRSVIERPAGQAGILSEAGERVVVLELGGFLFFGSAYGLIDRVRAELSGGGISGIVLDLSRVSGLDGSAVKALARIREACEAAGVELSVSALPPEARALWLDEGGMGAALHADLDSALVAAEERLLACAEGPGDGPGPQIDDLLERLPESLVRQVSVAAGSVLFEEGGGTREIFVLRSGRMHAELARGPAAPLVVARYLPGALIGEIAFYGDMARTATVRAESDAVLLRIDPALLEAEAGPEATRLHAAIAGHLARRLARTTQLLRQISV